MFPVPLQTLNVIKKERYHILKNNREIAILKTRGLSLAMQLDKLQEPVAGPSWAK